LSTFIAARNFQDLQKKVAQLVKETWREAFARLAIPAQRIAASVWKGQAGRSPRQRIARGDLLQRRRQQIVSLAVTIKLAARDAGGTEHDACAA
jgi:hypothetical protein